VLSPHESGSQFEVKIQNPDVRVCGRITILCGAMKILPRQNYTALSGFVFNRLALDRVKSSRRPRKKFTISARKQFSCHSQNAENKRFVRLARQLH